MSNDLTTWRPKEEKTIRTGMNVILGLGVLVASVIGIKMFVPSLVDALALLQKLFANGISLALTVGALAIILFLLSETFSKNGSINKLFNQFWSSLSLKLTYAMLDIDPISPLVDKKAEMLKKKTVFAEAFAKFDGAISSLNRTADDFQKQSQEAEAEGKQALKCFKETGDVRYENAQKTNTYKAGQFAESAQTFRDKVTTLIPIRGHIAELRNATDVLMANLDVDITRLKAEWEASKNISEIEGSARSMLNGTSKDSLARDAQALIQTKYATEIGRLANLADATQPLIMSIDLQSGSYNDKYLAKWEEEARLSPVVVTQQITGQVVTPQNSFSSLIN